MPSRLNLIARWKELLKGVKPIAPRVVSNGPILENVKTGAEVDMTIFPTPHWHELDGGRYIGTADCVITGEPEEGGWVNVGIYRVQIHDKNTLGLYVSPGHHARIMREKYWEKGKSCPVVVTFGQDPLLFLVAGQSMPYGMSEFDYYGGLRGAPIDVIRGELTGLADTSDGRDRHRRRSAAAHKNRCRWKVLSANGLATTPTARPKSRSSASKGFTIATIRFSAAHRR